MREIKRLQSIFQTLSDYNRLIIIKSICDKELSVGEIVSITKLSQPLVSHHLKILKNNEFLDTRRKGPFIYYYLNNPRILYGIDVFLEIFKKTNIEYNKELWFCSDMIFRKFNK